MGKAGGWDGVPEGKIGWMKRPPGVEGMPAVFFVGWFKGLFIDRALRNWKIQLRVVTRHLEIRWDEAWRAYDQADWEINRHKDALVGEISRRLEERMKQNQLFVLL